MPNTRIMSTLYTEQQHCVHFVRVVPVWCTQNFVRVHTKEAAVQCSEGRSVCRVWQCVQLVLTLCWRRVGALCTLGNGNTKGALQSRGANRRNRERGERTMPVLHELLCALLWGGNWCAAGVETVVCCWGGIALHCIGGSSYSQQESAALLTR